MCTMKLSSEAETHLFPEKLWKSKCAYLSTKRKISRTKENC